jgi:hypothetical protein
MTDPLAATIIQAGHAVPPLVAAAAERAGMRSLGLIAELVMLAQDRNVTRRAK